MSNPISKLANETANIFNPYDFCSKVADGVGFEPTVGSHLRRFSRPLP
jgi:hypothetical protein